MYTLKCLFLRATVFALVPLLQGRLLLLIKTKKVSVVPGEDSVLIRRVIKLPKSQHALHFVCCPSPLELVHDVVFTGAVEGGVDEQLLEKVECLVL